MTWTSERPTRQGWYFARILPNEKVFVLSIVGVAPFLKCESSHGADGYQTDISLYNMKEWAGPIPNPTPEGTDPD